MRESIVMPETVASVLCKFMADDYIRRSQANLAKETLIKSTFYGEPAQLCDAGMNKIKVLAPLILPQKFPHLFNQHFPKNCFYVN